MNASNSGSGSNSDGGDTILPADSPVMAPSESCMYTKEPGANGLFYRSCRSCLSKTDCGVGPNGYCFQSNAPAITDYRTPYPFDPVLPVTNMSPTELQCTYFQRSFLASQFNYCSEDDAVCTACVRDLFGVGWTYSDSRYCVGVNGCICISVCEYPNNTKPRDGCSANAPSDASSSGNPGSMRLVGYLMALVIVVMWVRGVWVERNNRLAEEAHQRRRQEAREQRIAEREQRRQRFFADRGIGLLGLAGWNKYREELIEKEQLQLSLTTTAQPNIQVREEAAEEEERQADHAYVEVRDEQVVQEREQRSRPADGA